jgi:ribosomal protein L29
MSDAGRLLIKQMRIKELERENAELRLKLARLRTELAHVEEGK